jgi:hypothetical protein
MTFDEYVEFADRVLTPDFAEYVERVLAQKKPHHVVIGMSDLLLWLSDGWEELGDCVGSRISERTFRRKADGARVSVVVTWEE